MKLLQPNSRPYFASFLALSIGVQMLAMPQLTQAAVSTAITAGTRAEAKKQSEQKATDKRKQVVSEAIATLRETQDALKELDDGKTKEALASLERATGKLEIVLARDPKLALIPINVEMRTNDVYASLAAIKTAKQKAEALLREGHPQDARVLLDNLVSETVIRTTNLPVATYPAALKSAAKLIDENKPAKAKEVLQNALNTMVITDLIVPLPVLRAQVSLAKADDLAKIKNRSTAQNKDLNELVANADMQIKYAEELGYGQKTDFDSFHKEIAAIRSKTSNGKSGNGFFDQIRTYIDSMTKLSQPKTTNK